jgi:uncharacterized protein YjbI with pentapeptide repeats
MAQGGASAGFATGDGAVVINCSAVAGQGHHEQGEAGNWQDCPVQMLGNKPCSRSIHRAPKGADEPPVCLMHSRDAGKDGGEFGRELERTLQEAGEGCADLTRFVFPESSYPGREFRASLWFEGVTFTRNVDFRGARFQKEADFREARFERSAVFTSAKFDQKASFNGASFLQDLSFNLASFRHDAEFCGTSFASVNFAAAQFGGCAYFLKSRFADDVNMRWSKFAQSADFREAVFEKSVYFCRGDFGLDARFDECVFKKVADFRNARFASAVEFRDTKFRQDPPGENLEPGPIFTCVSFQSPERVTFYQTYLGQALFHSCNVSKIDFSAVAWRRRDKLRSMVFDEAIDPKYYDLWAEALKPPDGDPNPCRYHLISELYHQLKKNYDDRADYWTAGSFHFGEMEVRRLYSRERTKALRWIRSSLGIVACYKYANRYGEGYYRPVLWMLLVLLVFALLYPVTGLRYEATRDKTAPSGPAGSAGSVVLTYGHPLRGVDDHRPLWLARLSLVGDSAMSTLYIAAFQKDLIYEPSYPWGRLFALAEVLLTSTLGALCLLAIRRQFRR